MRQVLHVLRKDIRRHWIEILLCQFALAAYCWGEIASRQHNAGLYSDDLERLLGFWIRIFLPIAWFLLTFRLVQSEPLVGDRQFWVTRPYEWKKLLFEKILFLLAFISLPTLLAGAFLLAKAGFSPLPHLAGLAWMQVMLLQPVLVLVALAAVTRNLAQGILIAVPVILVELILGIFINDRFSEGSLSTGGTHWLDKIVFIVPLGAALLLQYSRRSTGSSRVWLAVALLAPPMAVFNPLFIPGERAYPSPAEGHPSLIRADVDTVKTEAGNGTPAKNESLVIQIPMVLWGVPQDSLASVRGARLSLETPDGFKWHSTWRSWGELFGPNENHWKQTFLMNYATYERMRGVPLKAKISLATEIYRQRNQGIVVATSGEFPVPHVGRCRINKRMPFLLVCHSPLVLPAQATVLRVDPTTLRCPVPNKDEFQNPWPGMPYAWIQGGIAEWAEFGVSPVSLFDFNFNPPYPIGVRPRFAPCPGTPLDLSFLQVVDRTRVDFQAKDFKLEDYYQSSFDSSGMWGVSW